jgi:hypothetical protein
VIRLRDYSTHFQPEELDAMTAAYDAAWQHLRTNRPSLTNEQIWVLKKNLAQIILASPCNGKEPGFGYLKSATTRAGAAEAPTIFSGNTATSNPCGGSAPRFVSCSICQ